MLPKNKQVKSKLEKEEINKHNKIKELKRKSIENKNEIKSCFFENMNKIYKPLTMLM